MIRHNLGFTKRNKSLSKIDVSDWRDYVLPDKNGDDVYEGQLVYYQQESGGLLPSLSKPTICIVEWDEFMLSWVCRNIFETKYKSNLTLSSCHITVYDPNKLILSGHNYDVFRKMLDIRMSNITTVEDWVCVRLESLGKSPEDFYGKTFNVVELILTNILR